MRLRRLRNKRLGRYFMVKERPALFYTCALVIGVLLYSKWPFIAGFLDLLTIAVATVVVVSAICCFVIKAGLRNASITVAMMVSGMLCGAVLCAVHDRIDIGPGNEWKTNITKGAAAVREKVADIYMANGLEGDELAVVAAMTLGDKRHIDRNLRNEYSKAGVAHVLALSGTHLAILYFIFMLVAGRGSVAARFVVVGTIWGYVVIVGMPVSAVRAAMMLSMFTLADVMRRGYDRMDVLVTTVAVMILIEPRVVLDVGFQLSVMSVGAIVVICPLLNGLLPYDFHKRHHRLSKIWGMVSVGIAAQIGTAPLVAYYFGTLPCWFVISNLVAVPLTTVLLYGAVAIVALWPLPLLQLWAVKAVGFVAWVMNVVLGYIANLPFAAIEGVRLSVLQVVICYIMTAALLKIITYIQIKT